MKAFCRGGAVRASGSPSHRRRPRRPRDRLKRFVAGKVNGTAEGVCATPHPSRPRERLNLASEKRGLTEVTQSSIVLFCENFGSWRHRKNQKGFAPICSLGQDDRRTAHSALKRIPWKSQAHHSGTDTSGTCDRKRR